MMVRSILAKSEGIAKCATVLGMAGLIIAGCTDGSDFTLYRNSALDEAARIHVASFDARDGEAYNRGNCEIAQSLFQQQPGAKTRFWCEKGRFRK